MYMPRYTIVFVRVVPHVRLLHPGVLAAERSGRAYIINIMWGNRKKPHEISSLRTMKNIEGSL